MHILKICSVSPFGTIHGGSWAGEVRAVIHSQNSQLLQPTLAHEAWLLLSGLCGPLWQACSGRPSLPWFSRPKVTMLSPQFYGELKEKEVLRALNSWLKACSEVRYCPESLKERLISWGNLIPFS